MKKLLTVLVLVLVFTSCSQDDDNLGGDYDGQYQRVSYTVLQDNGTSITYPQLLDNTQQVSELSILNDVWVWVYNSCECEEFTIGYHEIVGEIVGSSMIYNGEVHYTIERINETTVKATTVDGIAFETFTIVQ